MAAAGMNWLRLDVPWRSIEPSCKNCIDWRELDIAVQAANAAGINIMARVDHPPDWARVVPAVNGPPDAPYDYADFVSVMASRYRAGSPRGTIHAIQVWNEPNINREWGGAVIDRAQANQYMYLLKETYQMVKAVDPTKIIVSAGLSPTGTNDGTAQPDDVYLDWMYRADLALYSDVVGIHGAGYGLPYGAELGSDPRFPHPSFYASSRIEQLRGIMEAHGDAGKQIWLLEFGWTMDPVNPQYSWYAVSPDQQAEYIVGALQYARDRWPWMGVMFVWNIPNPNWNADFEQYWWGITEPDGSPRPAYCAIMLSRTGGLAPPCG